MPKFLSSADALSAINQRLQKPISRQQFNTVYRLMAQRGDATPTQPRQRGLVLESSVADWVLYLRTRENLIAANKWGEKQAYSLQDMDDIVSGGLYESYQPE